MPTPSRPSDMRINWLANWLAAMVMVLTACCDTVVENGHAPNPAEAAAMQASLDAFDAHPDFELTDECLAFMDQVRIQIWPLARIQKRTDRPMAIAFYTDGVCADGPNIVYSTESSASLWFMITHETIHALQACSGLPSGHDDTRLWGTGGVWDQAQAMEPSMDLE